MALSRKKKTWTLPKRIGVACSGLFIVLLIGVAGFKYFGGSQWSWLDALYMTVITLSTVGYGEIHALSTHPGARIFAIFIILFGVGLLAFVVSSVTAFVVEGELTDIFGRKKMNREIEKLRDHYIVCGVGETGFHVADELLKTRRSFVAVDSNTQHLERLQTLGSVLFFEGDATRDEDLLQAGIDRARGLVATLPTDEANLFATITARELNPKLRIISKMIDDSAHRKFLRAGADAIVSPTYIGGMRLVSELVRPTVVTFLDKMLHGDEATFRVEEITIPEDSDLAGQTLEGAGIARRTGALVLAIREPDGSSFAYNPPATKTLQVGSTLVVLGSMEMMERIRKLV